MIIFNLINKFIQKYIICVYRYRIHLYIFNLTIIIYFKLILKGISFSSLILFFKATNSSVLFSS